MRDLVGYHCYVTHVTLGLKLTDYEIEPNVLDCVLACRVWWSGDQTSYEIYMYH